MEVRCWKFKNITQTSVQIREIYGKRIKQEARIKKMEVKISRKNLRNQQNPREKKFTIHLYNPNKDCKIKFTALVFLGH
ncbi:hypothetical protein RM51_14185 [Chryseobacterium taiwanense]|uniref:Uncharacterized protein n=1 Tax=Chryseobacterium taiwanense TaxID=363331 RepID=A0A0B4DCG8_9FLAO|nr:hypothetical protein RM51_14185 [Chryseobacterium taiwanense]